MPIAEETEYQGQELINPPSVEGWHTGAEWIDSGALVRRINFAGDRLSNINLPGVQSMVGRVKAQGTLTPTEFVDSCLDVIGPLEVTNTSRQELITLAQQGGDLRWDTDQVSSNSAQRIGDMLALIAASREYQFN